jgi:hypothetical protein
MNKKKYLIVLLIIIMEGCTHKGQEGDKIGFSSLLNEITDRKINSRFPDPYYRLMQASSWDRTQKGPKDTSTWFANKDYNHWLREEKVGTRTEYVLMDAKGPGVITRWWLPLEYYLKHRILRIYLNGNPEPVIEENYHDFMKGSSFVKWPFAFISSDEKDVNYQYDLPVGHPKQMGASFYLPISFSKRCKVTLDDKPFFYVINYRMYQEGTKVTSFSKGSIEKNKALLATKGDALLTNVKPGNGLLKKRASVSSGESLELALPKGENAIHSIFLMTNSKENKQKNRGVVISITFDGKQTVWSPVSEFFGGGVYNRPAGNYYLNVSEDGTMSAMWVMPYQKEAKLEIINYGDEILEAELGVDVGPYEWDKSSMYFHAKWHEEAPLNTPPFKDWNYVTVEGKGIYVGDVLTVYAVDPHWWGEGDEKIYIDGEKFPSHLGTGLEDYYGYAWGMANFFSSPFISMPERDARGKTDWRGYTTVARVRQLDAIPFKTELKVDVEAWQQYEGTSYSVTSFWYAQPGATDNIEPNENTITRTLPDFSDSQPKQMPGEPFPDPADHGLIKPLGNGSIRQVGNHLDFLGWKDIQVHKPLDIDLDNEYGTAGFYLPAVERYNAGKQAFEVDSFHTLPDFVSEIATSATGNSFHNARLSIPTKKRVSYITGYAKSEGFTGTKEIITFTVNDLVPPVIRLGIMVDNTDTFDKVGESFRVLSSSGGDSGVIPIAQSNRVPDWYFIDIEGLKLGDMFSIIGKLRDRKGIFTIGGITFDNK